MREIKEDREVEALENAADMISDILCEVISALKPGVMEKDVAWQIKGLAKEAGAEGLSFPSIVASGAQQCAAPCGAHKPKNPDSRADYPGCRGSTERLLL